MLGSSGEGFDTATARARTLGWAQAMAAAGLHRRPTCAGRAPRGRPGPRPPPCARASTGDAPDALFCFTDSLAIGAVHSLWEAGLRVPDDVSLAGFDDVADGRFALPPLTTVGLDKRLYAERALELLAARIADRDRAPELVVIPHEIVPRASTARAPRAEPRLVNPSRGGAERPTVPLPSTRQRGTHVC